MGLENIVKDILEQARTEVTAINAQADEEAAAIINEAKAEAEKIDRLRQDEVGAQIERMRKQELSSAHLEIKRSTLNAKKDVLDSVYQSAKEIISSLPAQRNTEILSVILDKYGSTGTRVYSNGRDSKLVQEMTDLTYMGEMEILGGLIIENEDGSVRLDYTYDTILNIVSELTLKQISEILFG